MEAILQFFPKKGILPHSFQAIESKAFSIPDQAKALLIHDEKSFQKAGEVLLTIKGLRKEIDETFDPIIKKAHETHKEAVAQKKKVDAPLVEAEFILKPRMASYLEEQEKKRREEGLHIEQELKRKSEEERLNQAISVAELGFHKEAEQILNQESFIPPVIVPKPSPPIPGISSRTLWKFQIIDQTLIPEEYKRVDSVKLGQVVRALGSQCRIPGIRVYAETSIAAGRRI